MATPAPGTRLGPYEITAKLGEGGMGEVWKAKDFHLGRDVALKVLPEGFTQDADRLARFEREAKLLAQLNHPNIAQIYGFEASGDTRALVMELVEGPTLAERLEGGPFLLNESLSVSLQIAQALEEAHEKGIVHRDLKPQNIKASIEGKVKVLDFGLAKAMDPTGSASGGTASASQLAQSPTLTLGATVQGVILGTAAYMAPEQARGVAVDKRADVWAFGVVLWEMLAGRRLFDGELVTDVLAQVLTKEVDLDAVPASTPLSVRRLLRRCLERNPKNRLRDIGEARLALEEILRGDSQLAAPALPLASSGETKRPARRLAFLPWVAAAFFLLIAIGVGVANREKSAPSPAASLVRFPLSADPSLYVYTELTTPFALAPDGETVVFVGSSDGASIHLWARSLDDPRPRRLDETEGGTQPAVSPNGEWVAFMARSNQIRKVRLRGGGATRLTTTPSVSASLTWASDDEILFEVLGTGAGIHRVGAAGGAAHELIPFDTAAGETRQRRPFVLRRERIVLYASSTSDGRTTLAAFSLADGRRARLEIEGIQALGMVDGRLIYARSDGNLMAVGFDPAGLRVTGPAIELAERVEASFIGTRVALSESGTLVYRTGSSVTRLVLVDAEGRSAPLGRETGSFNSPRFSPDGRRIVAVFAGEDTVGGSSAGDLVLFDRASGEATRLTRGGGALSPTWTPDGRRIVYVQGGPAKAGEIWSLTLDGSAEPSRLVEVEGNVIEVATVPDGRSLIAIRTGVVGQREELVSVALDAGGKATSLLSEASRESIRRPTVPRVSPDGRYLAFSDHASWEVFVRPLDGAGLLQVTDGGGWSPVWAPDGQRLYVGHGTVLGALELRFEPSLTVESRRIVTQLGYNSEEFDVSPDGKQFVFVAPAVPGSDVQVAVHWSDALRRSWRAAAGGEGAQ